MSTDRAAQAVDLTTSPEQRYLDYARTGDKAIIQSLIMEFADRAYTQARRIIGQAHGAEDAVQDAYLRLVHSAKKYDGSVPFAAWLGRLVSHAAINHRERRLSRHTNFSDMSDQGASAMNKQMLTEESPDSPEVEAVRAALDTLPAHYRTPLTLYYFGGLNQSETAHALGAPASTIANQLARGLEQLREKLGRAGFAVTSAGLLSICASLPTYAAPSALKAGLIAVGSERLAAAGRHILEAKKAASLATGAGIFKAALVGGLAVVATVTLLQQPDMAKPTSVPSAPVQAGTGLIAHWTFDEGRGLIANDRTGNGHTGELVNGPIWAPGKIGGALSFNGIDNYVRIPSSSAFNSMKDQMTVVAWVFNREEAPAFGSIIQRRQGQDVLDVWNLYYDMSSDRRYSFSVITSSKEGYTTVYGQPSYPDLNAWVHLAGVYDGTLIRLFRNGVLQVSGPCTGTLATETTPVMIGACDTGVQGMREHIDAVVDDVRLYNRALSDAEIAELAQVVR
jgi:RNA polymerase sigma factor (sigma-70 family)